MPGPLGTGEYEAYVVDNRAGDAVVADLTSVLLRGQWDRVLDDDSQGQVTLAWNPECCDLLCKFTVVRHDLVIVRNGDVVWQGPITRIRSERSNYQVRIVARDVVWWLQNRVVAQDYTYSGNLGTYIVRLITDAMSPDPRNWLSDILLLPGIVDGVREQNKHEQLVYNELRELARTVLDYTTVGKRLIIGPDLYTLGSLPPLTDEHFLDGVEVLVDGEDYRNVSYVRYNQDQIVFDGEADAYFGLVEGIVREFSIQDEPSARAAAAIDSAQGSFPPVLLFGEGGAILSPHAPVGVNDLVPGMVTDIVLDEMCPAVSQTQRLLRVEANFSNTDGESPESVGTRWGPLGATGNRRQDV